MAGNVAGGLVLGVASGGAGWVGTAAKALGYAGDVYQAGKAASTGDWQALALQIAAQGAGYYASKTSAGKGTTKNTPTWNPKDSMGAPHTQGGSNGWCFTAGTLVAVAAGSKAIEEIKVGDRVLTTDSTSDLTEVNPSTWFSVSVEAPNPDGSGDILEITRLCSPEWVITHGCKPGASFFAELEEMKFTGRVTVTSMGPCPPVQRGLGRVVTMTVTHVNSFVYELELTGFDASGRAVCETLCPTNVHKLFSASRNDWVMTQDLRVGEALRTQSGISTITGVKRKAGDQRVYNFEVEQTHAYYVGQTRTLSHNTDCPVTTRHQAFREAKHDAGIPLSQQPADTRKVPYTGEPLNDPGSRPLTSREYVYENVPKPGGGVQTVVIQEHALGHKFRTPPAVGPHFNVRPLNDQRNGSIPGCKKHYEFNANGAK